MNPILNLLGRANPAVNNLAQLMSVMKAANNPMEAVNTMAQNDPRMKQVQDVIAQNGGSVQQAVRAIAQQRGIDINALLQQAQGMMK